MLTRLERCERCARRRRLALRRLDQHPLAHAEHEDLMRAAHAEAAGVDVMAVPALLDAAQERGGRRLLAALLLQPLLPEQPADLRGMRSRLPRCRGAEVPRCRARRGRSECRRRRGGRGRRGYRGCRGRRGRREGLRPRAAEACGEGEQVRVHAGPAPVVSDEHPT
eukprot:scaffold12430_cov70-Phaeocystis_antarctica.AAC.5